MKLHYYPETDSLYIEFSAATSVETRAITDTVNLDLAADGGLAGIAIDQASKQLDLATLETAELPFSVLRAA